MKLEGFCEAEWANLSDRKSMSGFCFRLAENNPMILYSLFRQNKTVFIKDRNIDIKYQFIRNEINKESILLEYVETEKKCSQHVHKANDRNKIKHFQKVYSR